MFRLIGSFHLKKLPLRDDFELYPKSRTQNFKSVVFLFIEVHYSYRIYPLHPLHFF